MTSQNSASKDDVWGRLAMPLLPDAVEWRQDGKPVQRDGKYLARFVAYVEANTVRERLDAVVPGEWDLTLSPLDTIDKMGREGVIENTLFAFKARLQVLGVVREDVGQGQDYKAAATDAFKRAAVRFGIGNELYSMPKLWIELDGDGKYAKPLEDPKTVATRKIGAKPPASGHDRSDRPEPSSSAEPRAASARSTGGSNGNKPAQGGRYPDAPFRDFLMPFGDYKKQPLSAIPDKDLRSAADWAESKGKFADLVKAAREELQYRVDAIGQGDLMAGAGAAKGAMPSSFDDFRAALEDQDDDLPF